MTTTTVTEDDLHHLRAIMFELLEAGRKDELAALARVHAVIQEIILTEFYEDDDDDPEFAQDMEEAERDFAEGRWIPHEEMVRRLEAFGDV